MASWREIDRIRKAPNEMRALSARLLKTHTAELTDWEITFLERLSRNTHTDEFTTRQAEKLVQIRDDYEHVSEIGYARYSVRILIEQCQLAHLDLREDDADWVLDLPKGTSLILRRDIGRLLRCARDLGLIEREDAA